MMAIGLVLVAVTGFLIRMGEVPERLESLAGYALMTGMALILASAAVVVWRFMP